MSKPELIRGLTRRDTTALVVGTIIGTGVFLKTTAMAQAVGSPFWVLVAWVVAEAMSLAGAGLCGAGGDAVGGGWGVCLSPGGLWSPSTCNSATICDSLARWNTQRCGRRRPSRGTTSSRSGLLRREKRLVSYLGREKANERRC